MMTLLGLHVLLISQVLLAFAGRLAIESGRER